MTLTNLTSTLEARGVRLSLRLVVDAPRGAITPELRDALTAHKPLLLHRLGREAAWGVLSAQRWGQAQGDPEPGIDIDPGTPTPTAEALGRIMVQGAADPYAAAEREAIQNEADCPEHRPLVYAGTPLYTIPRG
jgi:hypothetical protein